jgi:TOD1/MUCI70, glycosyltransferase-like domain
MSHSIIISANVGGFDEQLERPGVTMLKVALNGEHPRLAAKRPKMLDVRAPGEYRYVIWIDSNMAITASSFVDAVTKVCGDAPLALWPHPDRDNIRDEVEASYALAPEKYNDQPLRKQAISYFNKGFKDDWGLYATGCLVWNLEHEDTNLLASYWLSENQKWSYQDQISLPYVLWRLNIRPALLPYNLRQNPWLGIGAHLSNR